MTKTLLSLFTSLKKMFILNISSMDHMVRVTWHITQINITQWHNKLSNKYWSEKVFKELRFKDKRWKCEM